jgi:hypothetical protein
VRIDDFALLDHFRTLDQAIDGVRCRGDGDLLRGNFLFFGLGIICGSGARSSRVGGRCGRVSGIRDRLFRGYTVGRTIRYVVVDTVIGGGRSFLTKPVADSVAISDRDNAYCRGYHREYPQ